MPGFLRPVLLAALCLALGAGEAASLPSLVCDRVLPGHHRLLSAAAFTPDGTRLLTLSEDRSARVWDAASGEELLVAPAPECRFMAISPDGVRLALAGEREIALWEVAGKAPAGSLETPAGGRITALAFSPDGRWLLGGTDAWRDQPGRVLLWELPAGRLAAQIDCKPGVSRLLVLPDSRSALIAERAGLMRSVALPGLKPLQSYPFRTGNSAQRAWGYATRLAVAADGRMCVSGHEVLVGFWNLAKTQPLGESPRQTTPAMGKVAGVAIAPDGRSAASAGPDRLIRVWDPQKGAPVRQWEAHGDGGVLALAYARDGRELVSIGLDGYLSRWDLATGKPLGRTQVYGHWYPIHALAWADAGRSRLISGGFDRTARIWDLASGRELQRWTQRDLVGSIDAVVRVPDDGSLLFTSYKTVHRWDGASGILLGEMKNEMGITAWNGFALAGDGKRVVCSINEYDTAKKAQRRALAAWDLGSGRRLWQQPQPDAEADLRLATDPGGPGVLAASHPGGALLRLDPGSGARTVIKDGFGGRPFRLLPINPGLLLLGMETKGRNGLLALDPRDGRELWRLESERDLTFAAAVSPDGRQLALGSGQVPMGGGLGDSRGYGPSLRLVDAASGAVLADSGAYKDTVWSVLFTAEGIIGAGSDGCIRRWRLPAP